MMKLLKCWILLCSLILVQAVHANPATAALGDEEEVKAAISEMYKVFNDSKNDKAFMDLAIYSKATSDLIAQWNKVPSNDDNISGLENGNWLCNCQDFDAEKFKITSFTFAPCGLSDRHARVVVGLDLGTSEKRDIFLTLHKEQGRWTIADIEIDNMKPNITGYSFQDQLMIEIDKGR
jgi:hypothetical protein